MKWYRHATANPRVARSESRRAAPGEQRTQRSVKPRHFWRTTFVVLLVLVILGGVGRALLPWFVRDYVNRTLDRNPLYSGQIGPVKIHLWRGAYSIHDIQISKTTGNVPVPLFAAKQLDFAVQWKALLHRKIVGQVLMDQPELN